MANLKPFVAVACFCENLLIEPDGVASAVRIIDTYNLTVPPELPPEALPVIDLNGLISLKSGPVTGKHTIDLVLETPKGERKNLAPNGGWPVVFEGGIHGVNLRIKFPLGVKNFGVCWFDVLFDGEVLTRIPLKLQQAAAQEPAKGPSPPN